MNFKLLIKPKMNTLNQIDKLNKILEKKMQQTKLPPPLLHFYLEGEEPKSFVMDGYQTIPCMIRKDEVDTHPYAYRLNNSIDFNNERIEVI